MTGKKNTKKKKQETDKGSTKPVSTFKGIFNVIWLTLFCKDHFLSKRNLHNRTCLLETRLENLKSRLDLLETILRTKQ